MSYKPIERPSMRPLVQFLVDTPVEATIASGVRSITTANGPTDIIDLDLIADAKFLVLANGVRVESPYAAGEGVSVFKTAGLGVDTLSVGSRVRITYRGKETNPRNNREYHAYDIEVWVND